MLNITLSNGAILKELSTGDFTITKNGMVKIISSYVAGKLLIANRDNKLSVFLIENGLISFI